MVATTRERASAPTNARVPPGVTARPPPTPLPAFTARLIRPLIALTATRRPRAVATQPVVRVPNATSAARATLTFLSGWKRTRSTSSTDVASSTTRARVPSGETATRPPIERRESGTVPAAWSVAVSSTSSPAGREAYRRAPSADQPFSRYGPLVTIKCR